LEGLTLLSDLLVLVFLAADDLTDFLDALVMPGQLPL
jgi:hypothetical protein